LEKNEGQQNMFDTENLAEKMQEIRDKRLGDIASTIAFDIAKEQGKNPTHIAETISKQIELNEGLIEKGSNIGAGNYTNFYGGHPYTFGPRHFLTQNEENKISTLLSLIGKNLLSEQM
jgi:arginyl-tRNA synthetase